MYRGKKQKFDWGFTVLCGDVAAIALSFPISFAVTRAIWGDSPANGIPHSILTLIVYAAIILIGAEQAKLYWWRCFVRLEPLLMRLPMVLLAAALVFGTLRYALANVAPEFMTPWLLVHYFVLLGLMIALRRFVFFFDYRVIRRIEVERIAFVGWSAKLDAVVKSMAAEMGAFQQIAGMIRETNTAESDVDAGHSYPVIGALNELEALIGKHEITLVLVDASNVSARDMRLIADTTARELVSLKMIPATLDIWASKLSVRVRAGIPVIGINDLHHDHLFNRAMKRTIDIVGALAGLSIAAPIIAVMSVMIYLESPGPVFYRQRRRGLGEREFDMIKLRSMRLDAEAQGVLITVENDPRRLKIGTFLRSWNLDELPQFWNVLVGDMSLVGPRPERLESVDNYEDTIRYYNLRHTCKPGLTGWAAVHGFRGNTSIEERIEYDLFYVENWSLLLDLKIIFMTLAPPKNAY